MTGEAGQITWLQDADGKDIGLRVARSGEEPVLTLVVPSLGLERAITAANAQRVVDMLERGIAFSKITDASSFRVDLDQL